MDAILDFTAPFSVQLFDELISQSFTRKSDAERILIQFQNHPQAWTRVDAILEQSTRPESKVLALRILDQLIQSRWKSLPPGERDGIKKYVVGLVINNAEREANSQNKAFLNKLNLVLVQILKHEWPHNWPNFITEIVDSSKSNLLLCENNMQVLKLLSEEIFDFSKDTITSNKAFELKKQMCNEFAEVFSLCLRVLEGGDQSRASLILATLQTLLGFLNWIPFGYIFQSELIGLLQHKYLEPLEYRNMALKCLTEIAALPVESAHPTQVEVLFSETLRILQTMVPIEKISIARIFADGSSQDTEFIQSLAMFITQLLNSHLKKFEDTQHIGDVMYAHFLLIEISKVDDREIFKVCLEYWHSLVTDLFKELQSMHDAIIEAGKTRFGQVNPMANGEAQRALQEFLTAPGGRRDAYTEVLSRLRYTIIEKMVRPEEVLIVENEEGEAIREIVRESDTISLYRSERDVLIYLTLLDVKNTQAIMEEKLDRHVNRSSGKGWQDLNKLCWAIGSISGAMTEDVEKQFLVTVIKELLGLCEVSLGKDNKAIVAANIMYVVGQYPRFLKAHWRFLKTVVNKLFEFMHEKHEGVQDMACDTFITIAQKCRRHFVVTQSTETRPYIEEVIESIPFIIQALNPQQTHTVYEAVGYMISASPNKASQQGMIAALLEQPRASWERVMQLASQGTMDSLASDAEVKMIANVLRTFVAVCIGSAGGSPPSSFLSQAPTSTLPTPPRDDSPHRVGGLVSATVYNGSGSFYGIVGNMFMDMIGMYRASSELISARIQENPKIAPKTTRVRAFRSVRKEILRLIETFVVRAESEDSLDVVRNLLLPPLIEGVSRDYQISPEPARDAEVLTMYCGIVSRLRERVNDHVQAILNGTLSCTLQMIGRNFTDYPDHRVAIFKLLKAINEFCFAGLISVAEPVFKLFVDSLMWGFKHPQRDIADMTLGVMHTTLVQLRPGQDETFAFYRTFYMQILTELIMVLTDSEHKSGFKAQCVLLADLIRVVCDGIVVAPLFDVNNIPEAIRSSVPSFDSITNEVFVRLSLRQGLSTTFSHMPRSRMERIVTDLFANYQDTQKFTSLLRDFLIELKQFSMNPSELYADEREVEARRQQEADRLERMRIPGMVKPSERMDDDTRS